jgi:hypothetical protein
VLALVGSGDRVAEDNLVPLLDHILDRDVKVGVGPQEPREQLLCQLRPGRFNRQGRTELGVGLDDLVDRLRDELRIAGVGGFYEPSHRRRVACYLGC